VFGLYAHHHGEVRVRCGRRGRRGRRGKRNGLRDIEVPIVIPKHPQRMPPDDRLSPLQANRSLIGLEIVEGDKCLALLDQHVERAELVLEVLVDHLRRVEGERDADHLAFL
jgi:hypothetical protein